jgi:hypothetical protein
MINVFSCKITTKLCKKTFKRSFVALITIIIRPNLLKSQLNVILLQNKKGI